MSASLNFSIEPYSGLDPLSIEGLRTHAIDKSSNSELLIAHEPSVIPDNPSRSLVEILLGKIGLADFEGSIVEVYKLPSDYATLASVLNDAAASGSLRADTFTAGVFSEIAHSLRKIQQVDAVVPAEISYMDIVVERDVASFKLLPPVEFIDNDSPRAIHDLGEQLLEELLSVAGSADRQAFVRRVYKGYTNELES